MKLHSPAFGAPRGAWNRRVLLVLLWSFQRLTLRPLTHAFLAVPDPWSLDKHLFLFTFGALDAAFLWAGFERGSAARACGATATSGTPFEELLLLGERAGRLASSGSGPSGAGPLRGAGPGSGVLLTSTAQGFVRHASCGVVAGSGGPAAPPPRSGGGGVGHGTALHRLAVLVLSRLRPA